MRQKIAAFCKSRFGTRLALLLTGLPSQHSIVRLSMIPELSWTRRSIVRIRTLLGLAVAAAMAVVLATPAPVSAQTPPPTPQTQAQPPAPAQERAPQPLRSPVEGDLVSVDSTAKTDHDQAVDRCRPGLHLHRQDRDFRRAEGCGRPRDHERGPGDCALHGRCADEDEVGDTHHRGGKKVEVQFRSHFRQAWRSRSSPQCGLGAPRQSCRRSYGIIETRPRPPLISASVSEAGR